MYSLQKSQNRLRLAIIAALAFHTFLISSLGFIPESRAPVQQRLEITLAQHSSSEEPIDADYIAQANQMSSGTIDDEKLMTTPIETDIHDSQINELFRQKQQQQTLEQNKQTDRVIESVSTSEFVLNQQQANELHENKAQKLGIDPSAEDLINQEIASLEAKLDNIRQDKAKRPRIHRITSVATKASNDAAYLHVWEKRIEAIGNRFYPEEARQKGIYGKLRLIVTLQSDGSIHDISLLESSGHRILDQAAIRTVQLAAPFLPFPPKMKKQYDYLEIIRTWHFHKGQFSAET